MANRASKGSTFERKICTLLSEWWSDGARDDIFWRTAGSGARAKVRGRKKKSTAGQHGDICATDPIGQPLIDVFTMELKRGYNRHTIADLLDKPIGATKQEYEKWIEQAIESHTQARSFTWMLIVQRDRRDTLVFVPDYALDKLTIGGLYAPQMTIEFNEMRILGTTLTNFLEVLSQSKIMGLQTHRGNK